MKKITFVLSFAMLLIFGNTNIYGSTFTGEPAKGSVAINGKVLDLSTGESLAGVAVQLDGTDLKTYTDLDGNFEFSEVLPGDYNIVFTLISYKNSLIEKVRINENSKELLEVKMQEAE